jgi:aryl-alcohol dehydrogenase-like predicted oxidoreductase
VAGRRARPAAHAHALDLTVTTWEPLGGGLLTGRYGSDRDHPHDTRIGTTLYRQRVTQRNLATADAEGSN